MKTILTRLKNTRGETLIESMVAILIFTFASILFLTLVTSAANINTTVKEADESFQAQQEAVETVVDESVSAQAVLFVDSDEDNICDEGEVIKITELNIAGVKDEDNALYAYVLEGME